MDTEVVGDGGMDNMVVDEVVVVGLDSVGIDIEDVFGTDFDTEVDVEVGDDVVGVTEDG